jgi:3-deoxy-manno-octulosonate cytidylyltransferase (CMP-KDO synthetase)
VTYSANKIGILIPARMASSRLPGKPLIKFSNLPMIEHVRRRALLNKCNLDVVVVTPDNEIIEVIESNGGQVIKSKIEHSNGLSRASEALEQLDWSHFILLQGDEILALPDEIDALFSQLNESVFDFVNCVAPLQTLQDLDDLSVVKGFVDLKGNIPFMFRSNPFSGQRHLQLKAAVKILGLFGMRKDIALDYKSLEPSFLEELESIEQLRFIQNAKRITALPLPKGHTSVNVESDIAKITKILIEDNKQNEILNQIL